jgi:hypothetical protein
VRNIIAVTAAVLLAGQVRAQEVAQPLPAPPEGEFAARMFLTPDANKAIKDYTEGRPVSMIKDAATSLHGHSFHVMYQIAGCAVDPNGKCNVTAAFEVIQPSGGLYMKVSTERGGWTLNLLVNEPPPMKGRWKVGKVVRVPMFGNPRLAEVGEYLILMKVTDHNRPDGRFGVKTVWKTMLVTNTTPQ